MRSNNSLNQITNPRKFAVKVLQMCPQNTFVSDSLSAAFRKSKLSPEDQRLAHELVMGIIRRQATLDAIISLFIKKDIEFLQPKIRIILQLGIYQIRYMDKIPEFAAVNESVVLAKNLCGNRPAGFVNAVLRSFLREPQRISKYENKLDPVKRLAFVESHPEWLIQRWLKQYSPDEVSFFCTFNNQRPSLVLRINTQNISVKQYTTLLDGQNVEYELSPVHPECIRIAHGIGISALPGYESGLFVVQDETPVTLIDRILPKKDESVLDICAAPGGKTCYLAQLVEPKGKVVAVDINKKRTVMIEQNIRRLNLENVTIQTVNATDKKQLASEIGNTLFDKIVIDAPCSNTGVLRKRVEARWRLTSDDIHRLARTQLSLLNACTGFIKPGGTILYATCSIDREENEDVARQFIQDNPEMRLREMVVCFPRSSTDSDGGFGAVFDKR